MYKIFIKYNSSNKKLNLYDCYMEANEYGDIVEYETPSLKEAANKVNELLNKYTKDRIRVLHESDIDYNVEVTHEETKPDATYLKVVPTGYDSEFVKILAGNNIIINSDETIYIEKGIDAFSISTNMISDTKEIKSVKAKWGENNIVEGIKNAHVYSFNAYENIDGSSIFDNDIKIVFDIVNIDGTLNIKFTSDDDFIVSIITENEETGDLTSSDLEKDEIIVNSEDTITFKPISLNNRGIYKVLFGDEVLKADSDGNYTTPAITENTVIYIDFEDALPEELQDRLKDINDKINEVKSTSANTIEVTDNSIILKNTKGEDVSEISSEIFAKQIASTGKTVKLVEF